MTSERERIALQIQAVVVADCDARDARDEPRMCEAYRQRAAGLLDGLDAAAQPFPDLQARLAAVRAQLKLG